MPKPSNNTKDGQAASTKRAQAALASQENRRSRRPLEGKSPTPSKRAVQTRKAQQVEGTASEDSAALLKRLGSLQSRGLSTNGADSATPMAATP
jgi:hypothetical protein